MSIIIGKGVSIKDLHKTTIEGGKAPKLDCQQFELRYSTNIVIHAIKCKLLRITTCENITITGSLINEIEVNNSKKILFAGSTIKKEPKITDSDVDYTMCIINIDGVDIPFKKETIKAVNTIKELMLEGITNKDLKKSIKKIRITELELIFCPKKNEIIQFDKRCVECKHFKGHYSATGYIECNYDGN